MGARAFDPCRSGQDRILFWMMIRKCRKTGLSPAARLNSVFSPEHILSENRDEIIVVITDTKRYAECRDRLTNLSLEENVHFFDGWHLDINFTV